MACGPQVGGYSRSLLPLYWVSFDTCADLRQGKGVEVFVSGARYEGEFFRDLFNGHGLYTVPPITRAERLRAYVMRMIYEASSQKSAHSVSLLSLS